MTGSKVGVGHRACTCGLEDEEDAALLQGLQGGHSTEGEFAGAPLVLPTAGSAGEDRSSDLFISSPTNRLISGMLFKAFVVPTSCTLASPAGNSGAKCREGLGLKGLLVPMRL